MLAKNLGRIHVVFNDVHLVPFRPDVGISKVFLLIVIPFLFVSIF